MNKQKHKLTKIQKTCIASAIILFGLLFVFILLRKYLDWPVEDTEKTALTGFFIFSLMPFIINLVDIIIERGGKIEYGDFKEVWCKYDGNEEVTSVDKDFSITIPVGCHFQFRNFETEPLRFIIGTMPPWPSPLESVRIVDHWSIEMNK